MDLVSIVIPVYNGEEYIADAIRSCLSQTYRPLEVIVVNDGSTDSSASVAKGLGARLIDFPHNAGAAEALRVGFEASSAKFVCWLSADDLFIDKDKVRKQVLMMDETRADWSYFSDCYVGADFVHWRVWRPRVANLMMRFRALRPLAIMLNNPVNASSVMIRRSALEQFGNFDPAMRSVDADAQLWFRYARMGARLAILDGAAVFYREHASQVSKARGFIPMVALSRIRMIRSAFA